MLMLLKLQIKLEFDFRPKSACMFQLVQCACEL